MFLSLYELGTAPLTHSAPARPPRPSPPRVPLLGSLKKKTTKTKLKPLKKVHPYETMKTRAARRAEAEKANESKEELSNGKVVEDDLGDGAAEGSVDPNAASKAAINDVKLADDTESKGKGEDKVSAHGSEDENEDEDDNNCDVNFICEEGAHKHALGLIEQGRCVFCEKKPTAGKAWSDAFKICAHDKCLKERCLGNKHITV